MQHNNTPFERALDLFTMILCYVSTAYEKHCGCDLIGKTVYIRENTVLLTRISLPNHSEIVKKIRRPNSSEPIIDVVCIFHLIEIGKS